MHLAAWLGTALARSNEWRVELQRQRDVLIAPGATPDLERLLELARALEQIDPDRSLALSVYQAGYRAGDERARVSMTALATELRAHVTLAELALAEHLITQDPEALLSGARSLVDAGLLERALGVFTSAIKEHPSLADTMTSSPRLRDLRFAVARAHMRKLDPDAEIDDCLVRARSERANGAAAFLVAARIARLASSPRYAAVVAEGAAACPESRELGALHEDLELERNPDTLLAYYAKRLERARGEAAWIEASRAAAFELILRDANPGLGLRLLRTSLEHAYVAGEPEVMRRHLAAWELLASGARATQSTAALLPLLRSALEARLPDVDALFVARLGLEIAWREVKDVDAARPFAARVAQLVPDHPLAAEFAAAAGVVEPVMPTITFKIPKLAAEQPPARAPRAVIPLDVVIELPSGGFFSAVLRDVSVTGAFVATKRSLDVGTVLSLEIKVPSGRDLETRSVRTDATVARRTELGCGLQFVSPPSALVASIEALLAKPV